MMIKMLLSAALVVQAMSTFALASSDCKDEARYKEVDKKELSEMVDKKEAFVVDVNGKESFVKNHVPGAIHYGAHEKDFAQMLPANKEALIVAYCGGPLCTAWKKAAEAACKLGYSNVRHFKGGLKGWLSHS